MSAAGQDDVWTIDRILRWTQNYFSEKSIDTPRLDAEILLSHILKVSRVHLYTHFDQPLRQEERAAMREFVQRRAAREPVAYILGEKEFYGHTLKVSPHVLVPRPETEHLVDAVRAWLLEQPIKEPRILDIGTGSGCIAISLAKNIPNAEIWALDVSQSAIEIARINAKQNKVNINFLNLDILKIKELPHYFDLIVSNPPYVKQQEKEVMHGNVLQHEPDQALYVSDTIPLVFYDKITDLAKNHLTKNGKLYFEINQYLGKETLELIQSKGFKNVLLKKDFLSNDRMIRAEKE